MRYYKTFMITIVYCCILTILTLIFSCESETYYPVLTEEQGDYVQLEFINTDGTIEYSSIEYQK